MNIIEELAFIFNMEECEIADMLCSTSTWDVDFYI